jgi:hypothetical protein
MPRFLRRVLNHKKKKLREKETVIDAGTDTELVAFDLSGALNGQRF